MMGMTDIHPIREKVRRLRTEGELSRRDLAEAAGLEARQIEYLEARGHTAPAVELLVPIARALGITLDELVA